MTSRSATFRAIVLGLAVTASTQVVAWSAAVAQDSQAEAPQTGSPSPTTNQSASSDGDIVVTAQRREERLQDVPISVTAVSADDARRLGVIETKNLQFTTPGLSFPEDNGTINPYIRGRGTNFSGPGLEGSIAIYIDDIYLQSQFGSSGLADISQLQVLKGPQGTLYGRNATGGAILINTVDPKHTFEGYAEVGYASYDTYHAEAVLNVPLTETLAVRLVGGYDDRGGFVRNVVDGKKQGEARRYQLRGKLLWEPTDEFKVLLKGEYQDMRADYLRQQVVDGANRPSGLKFYQTQQSPRNPKANGGENMVEVRGVSGRFEYNADNFSVSNITGYRDTRITSCSDNDNLYERSYDFCPALPGSVAATGVRQIPNRLDPNAPSTIPYSYDRTFTTETRLTSSFEGAFNFLLGGSYQHSKARFAAVLTGTTFGPFIPVFDNHIKVDNYAVYGEAYLNITDQLKLTAGGRYSKDEKEITIYNNADLQALGIPLAFIPARVNQKKSFNSFTPRVVLAYDTGPANFYLSYSAGFKSGGFNAPSIFPQTPLSPEKIDGYEAGAKLRLAENTLWLDLAAFHTKTKDIQVASIDTATGSVVQQNAASAKAEGAEANIRYKPAPELTLSTGVAYLHSRFTSFGAASVFNVGVSPIFGQTALVPFSENLAGRQTPLSPKWTLNGAATYDLALPADWSAVITLAGRYSSSYDFQAGAGGPQRYARQKSFAVVNLSTDISPPGEALRFTFYVNNLFKQHYYDQLQTNSQSGGILQGGGVYGVQALPRVIGGRVRYSF